MNEYLPYMISSGQYGTCAHCKKQPILDKDNPDEVYDGCLGKLQGDIVNACCGHGDNACAYIQYKDGTRLGGLVAIQEQLSLKEEIYD